ncbi:TIGR03749 family integrating conjugative element protein [Klebsiella oxytoca]|uniref:Conjugal transfer protein n=1 Tax=Enterobacter cloacae subsp. cloacae TaxID=336306 RepID=A0AAE2EGT7_ENTCL|nr:MULTISPECIES: TIGR03749 family integrating conjugative element protein [Enterobacteriaceae]AVL80630.1 TIGR03749 family integrating conjugative element protein [Klebsiella oxytoca]EKX5085100.1 TIGR03749 family integrating conjugative element protein [Klebsiella oxytoca]EKX5097243.1 TIGR03749 family integrating conjugative element protein [Klebsiella oxytoca]ELQ8985852.1 TIGR03749 family integrating conjugative element protein [Klebsiella oxytoca]KJM41186.1 conjugal transfer protein [Enteroba
MKYLFFALLFSLPAFATEVVQWENIPLPIALHVGQERIVDVGKAVRIGYPATLEGKVRLQSAGGKVFLLANTAFPSTRIQLRDTGSGELILLDIQATQGTSPLEPVKISYAPQTPATAKTSVPVTASTEPLPILLVRYAAQNLYAPLRTVEALPGVTPAPVRLAKLITTLLPQQPVTATPLAAWQVNATTVTAIRLQNQSGQRITLDPRELQGQFTAAAFQHDWLGPCGLAEDTTVVYLVTEGPVSRALLPEPKP